MFLCCAEKTQHEVLNVRSAPRATAAGLQSKWARRRKIELAELINENWNSVGTGYDEVRYWIAGLPVMTLASTSMSLEPELQPRKWMGYMPGEAC